MGNELECFNCGTVWEFTGRWAPGIFVDCPECYHKKQVPRD